MLELPVQSNNAPCLLNARLAARPANTHCKFGVFFLCSSLHALQSAEDSFVQSRAEPEWRPEHVQPALRDMSETCTGPVLQYVLHWSV